MKNLIRRLFALQFVKFCITGGLGLLTDMAVFSFLKSYFKVESTILLYVIPVFGYVAAVTQNYLINHYWTFGEQMSEASLSKKAYVSFFAVSLMALIPRYIVYISFLRYFGNGGFYPHLANFSGIVAATVFNFAGSKFFVFTGKRK